MDNKDLFEAAGRFSAGGTSPAYDTFNSGGTASFSGSQPILWTGSKHSASRPGRALALLKAYCADYVQGRRSSWRRWFCGFAEELHQDFLQAIENVSGASSV